MIRELIPQLLDDHDLTADQAQTVMRDVMSGQATPAQTAAFLVAMKKKGETVDEVTAMAEVMREYSRQITPKVKGYLLDTCGTGGDRTKTFNVSTTCAFVIAGAGVPLAKHGNRSFTSKCGSADVLEALGLNLEMTPERVERSIEEIGIGFMYAPLFHPAMLKIASVRRDIGVRTVFNILGPLTNPARANAQLLGVYDPLLLELMCNVGHRLGCSKVMTVHALDGIDEISVTGQTLYATINRHGQIERGEFQPEYYGLRQAKPDEIAGSDPTHNARLTARLLSGKINVNDARLQMVLLNAAAGLMLCEKVANISDGIELSRQAVLEGKAYDALHGLIEFSGGNTRRLEELS